jgi:hypothetical protein
MILENMPTKPHPNATVYQGEDAELFGGAIVETNNKGYTGKGYVSGYYGSSTACTTFTVQVPVEGEYFISLRYAAGAAGNWSTDRIVGLSVNGESTVKVPFKSMSATWDIWAENIQKISLKAGRNTIAYKCITDNDNSDCINIDKLSVWTFYANPTLDGIMFNSNNYNVSEKYALETAIYEIDTNGIQWKSTSRVTYSSLDSTIVTIDETTGVITGVKEGTTTITAKSKGFSATTIITVLANPTITIDCAAITRPVNPSTFGYILTPNYDVPDSRMTLLGPLLNRDTIPAQNFQAIGDLDGSYYPIEGSILQRCLESYRRARAVGYKWYMLLGMNPSWATSNGSPLETFKNMQTKSDAEQAHFKQYIKDVLQYFKDNGEKPDFADLTNEYWTGTERTFKGNWEAVREVYSDFIPTVGPGAVGFAGVPDYYIPYASENNITVEGPCWHEFWINDKYVTLSQLENWKNTIAKYQKQYPETNGKYIIWEENNAGSKNPTDWTRSMANVIRTGVTQNIKGCLEPHNANGMSDFLTTNVIEQNPAARRPIWWVHYMFGQMSGEYVDISTDLTEDFTAAACTDINETKIIFAKNASEGLVNIKLSNQPYKGEDIKVDLYKIISSENSGLQYQYSIATESTDNLSLTVKNVGADETWMAVIKRVKAAPSFFCPIAPDDGEVTTSKPTFTWATAQDATSYNVKVSLSKDMSSPVINRTGIRGTTYTIATELIIGEKYYWSVTAVNEYGSIPATNNAIYSFIVGATINVPGQFGPYLPSVNAPNESVTPEFKWSTAYNATSYRLVISKNADMSNPVINKADIITVRDTGMYGPESQGYYESEESLEYDTKYYWRVYAVNSSGERPMNGPLHYFTTRAEGDSPKAFSIIAPQNGARNISARAELSWEVSKNAFFYKLEVSANSDMSDAVILRDRMIHNKYTVEPNLLEPNTTYYWRVTAYTKSLEYSKEASKGIFSFTVEEVPCSPLLYAEKAENGKIKLWFQPSKGATSYKIKYGTTSSKYAVTISDVKASPYEVISLTNNIKYYFAVVAVNEKGDSSIWNERSATPIDNCDD